MDVPGGEPGSAILANSRKRVVYLIASMHIRGVGKNHPNQRHDAGNARHDDWLHKEPPPNARFSSSGGGVQPCHRLLVTGDSGCQRPVDQSYRRCSYS